MTNNSLALPASVANNSTSDLSILVKPPMSVPVCNVRANIGGITVTRIPGRDLPGWLSQLTQKLMDIASGFFRVSPNPVASGASLHIEWNESDEGYYTFQLVNHSGRKIFSTEIWIDKEARLLNLEVPAAPAGHYLLSAINKESGKGFTEKIVIQ